MRFSACGRRYTIIVENLLRLVKEIFSCFAAPTELQTSIQSLRLFQPRFLPPSQVALLQGLGLRVPQLLGSLGSFFI